jgi:hypothetical protein
MFIDDDLSYIGIREVWEGQEPFGLSTADRRQHVYCVGKTGTGKTTLLRNLILQDLIAGRGVGVIDPHGDLAKELLDLIPRRRSDDLVYFDPSDYEHPMGINLFPRVPPRERHLIASGVVSAFKGIWREFWGPRLEYILYATIAALQECENVSLLGVQRMLVDESYRKWVVNQVKDPAVKSFWTREFAAFDKRFLAEILAPIQNKVGQLLMAAPLRNILGQVKSKVDLRFMMDTGRIFIANLSKGRIGEDKANLLGALLVTQFQLAAMSRADTPESERRDFCLYVDEFHNFTTDSFASILSEARKYRLSLILSNQYTAQLRPEIRDAVFGNVGTIISFRIGQADATILEREFGGRFTAAQFAELANHRVYVKPVQAEISPVPFAARPLAALPILRGCGEQLVRLSRQKYASKLAVVEDKLLRWARSRRIESGPRRRQSKRSII